MKGDFMRRVLKLDNEIDVYVDVYDPIEDPETDGDYICEYSITGLPKAMSGDGMGIDAIQAICITLCLIGNRLYSTEEFKKGGSSGLARWMVKTSDFQMDQRTELQGHNT